MEENKIKEVKKNVDILFGSVESHKCDPRQDCDECEGSGKCKRCGGRGKTDCKDCHGSGDCHDCHGLGKETCKACHGQGTQNCNKCGGSGTCRRCGGSGRITCPECNGRGRKTLPSGRIETCHNCKGTGNLSCPDCSGFFTGGSGKCSKCKGKGVLACNKCKGSGQVKCSKCDGSGKCKKCKGTGELKCNHCDGSGKCENCSGTGKITCKRCKGSGWYQTYLKCETTLYSKEWTHTSKNPIDKAISSSHGNVIYDDLFIKWKSVNQVEFDKTAEAYDVCKSYLGASADKLDEFVCAYDAYKENKALINLNDKPYSRRFKVEAIPVTKIEYTVNGKDYYLYISGDNHIVSYEEVPREIQAYSYSFFERVLLSMSEKKRMEQYAKLAAYIFQCDGKSKDESKILNLCIKELSLSESNEKKFRAMLEQYNSSMPYEVFRKNIKSLFATKKTISFAWQCMAIDKKLSENETKLFQNICNEYNGVDTDEIESLKQYAKRFSRIKDERIIAEYCDMSTKSKRTRIIVYISILCCIIGIVSIVISLLYNLT